MMKCRYAALLLVLAVLPLYPMEWPADGTIKKNFGWNDEGKPVLGVEFITENQVMAAEQGELLFSGAGINGASRLPSPLGSWTALDHGGGIIGIYSRMNGAETPELVDRLQNLGTPGITGWSSENGVYFSLFDRKERRWINPVMIINPLPVTGAPAILSVKLRNQEGRIIEIGQERTISQGRYAIIAETSQTIQGRSLAPFRIICSINGVETGGLNFETYSARDGVLMVYRNGLVPVRQIYSPYPAYELGTAGFARGQVTLEVIAQDAEGNSRNQVFRFTVE